MWGIVNYMSLNKRKEFAANESRESGLRFMRIMKDDTK